MGHRVIEQLKWVAERERGPWKASRRSLRPIVRAGLAYEKKALAALSKCWPQLRSRCWLEFEDANGCGWAQPDAWAVVPGPRLLVFECKLSYVPNAWSQVGLLYAPLLSRLLSIPQSSITPVQVCKVLRPEARQWTIVQKPEAIQAQGEAQVLFWRPGPGPGPTARC